MTHEGPLLLAGGGHSHALVLKHWAMCPRRRPSRSIVLLNRHSTALYSGMVPGLIAGIHRREELAINLRRLCDSAGVAFVRAEITGLDPTRQLLRLQGRPPLRYGLLSLDVGAVTANPSDRDGVPIKPLELALQFLEQQNPHDQRPFRVVGAGAAGLEVVLALRRRWPQRPLELQAHPGRISGPIRASLIRAGISLVEDAGISPSTPLLCTGVTAPHWLGESGLPVNREGRLLTDACLQVKDHPGLFASGDCALISSDPRPASGVWAVRAASPLARNLEAACRDDRLWPWRPQRQALQLIGNQAFTAWGQYGRWSLGPSRNIWQLKQWIDQRFMAGFARPASMKPSQPMACRGCAAKLPAQPLTAALKQVGLGGLAEDASLLGGEPPRLQSIDGFPALLSDPWLNGRITALHACSDLWACGAEVTSAMTVVTLPMAEPETQQELLFQTLDGIQSVLKEQGAQLIGGHTLEARSAAPAPMSLGLQVSLSVNGSSRNPWPKGGIQVGDALLLSRPLGNGVLFAAAMAAAGSPAHLDAVLTVMGQSQHGLVDQLQAHGAEIHACTDITGFGLLGHLGEMLQGSTPLRVKLSAARIPVFEGVLSLLEEGYASSLAPANREAWHWLDGPVQLNRTPSRAMLELLVDPQTCGPLIVACTNGAAQELMVQGPWMWIGTAADVHG